MAFLGAHTLEFIGLPFWYGHTNQKPTKTKPVAEFTFKYCHFWSCPAIGYGRADEVNKKQKHQSGVLQLSSVPTIHFRRNNHGSIATTLSKLDVMTNRQGLLKDLKYASSCYCTSAHIFQASSSTVCDSAQIFESCHLLNIPSRQFNTELVVI